MEKKSTICRAVAGAFMVLAAFSLLNCSDSSPPTGNGGPPPVNYSIVMEKPEDGAVFFVGDSVGCTFADVLPSGEGLSKLYQVTSPSGTTTRTGCGRPPGRAEFFLLEWDLPKDPIVMDEVGTWKLQVTATDPLGTQVASLTKRWEVRERPAPQ